MTTALARVAVILALPLLTACETNLSGPARTTIVTLTKHGDAFHPSAEEYVQMKDEITRLLSSYKLELSDRTSEATFIATVAVSDGEENRRAVPYAVVTVDFNPYRRVSLAGWRGQKYMNQGSEAESFLNRKHPSFELAERAESHAQSRP